MRILNRSRKTDGGKPSESIKVPTVKQAITLLMRDSGVNSQTQFAAALRKCVESGDWVPVIGGFKSNNKFWFNCVYSRNRPYLPWYTDPSEIMSKAESTMFTDINKLIDTMFADSNIAGMIINPDTDALCIDKGYFLKIVLHSQYNTQHNVGSAPKDWGIGIPVYVQSDLMTKNDFLNFAMHTIIDCEEKEGYRIVSANDNPNVCPNLILEKNGELSFVVVDGYCAESEPAINEITRARVAELGKRYQAKCFWGVVGYWSATDLLRSEKCLALKGDGFYAKYEGLRPI